MSASHLPPVYVDLQEEIEYNLQEITTLTQDLKRMHQKRIKESFFEEDETLHLNIEHKTHSITSLIKQSELKLKELMNVRTTEKSDEQSKSWIATNSSIVRRNMQTILAERLKTVTFELRRMEKDHFAKVQELHGSSADTRQSDEFLVQEFEEETALGHKGAEV